MRILARIALIVVLVSLPALAVAAYASDIERSMIARALEGQHMIFDRNYPAAEGIFLSLTQEFPDHPIGYFGRMAVLEMRMLEREDFHLANQFEALAREGQGAIVKTFNRRPSDWDLLSCGSLMGLDGFYQARRKNWWPAYSLGVKSRQTFKRIKRRNPEFYDADFGLGMYLYWRSVFIKDISFLSIFPDKREEGIAIVRGVVEKGSFARDLAEVNLGMIWLEERQYDKAHVIFRKFADRHPGNVLLPLFDARALIGGKRYDEAVSVLTRVMTVDPSIVRANYFIGMARALQKNPVHYPAARAALTKFLSDAKGNEWKAAAHYWLGRIEEQAGNGELAQHHYEEAFRYNPNLKHLKLKIRGMGSGL